MVNNWKGFMVLYSVIHSKGDGSSVMNEKRKIKRESHSD